MKNNIKELIIAGLLIIISILLIEPFHLWMSSMTVFIMYIIAFILFGIFASFFLKEKSIDERENQHKGIAGRNAFLAGSIVLIIAIAVQGYSNAVDPWLVGTFVIMIIAKVTTRIWSDKNL